MLRVLTTAAITASMLVTARMMTVRPCPLLQHKKLTNTKREKIEGRKNHHQNLHHQIHRIFPLQNNQSRKVILLKATDFKSYLTLSHKWELPGEIAGYVNHRFECFIQEKDVEENLLVLQPVLENVRGVKKLGDFVKPIIGQSAQQKILDVLEALSRLWKGLDIKNAQDNTVPVPVEDHIRLFEQTVLLLGQASNSTLYIRRLRILETLIKDPKKAKNILKEKADLLEKSDQNLFGKKFRSHVVETERSIKRKLKVFLVETVALLLLQKRPFGQALHRTATNRRWRAILLR